MRTESVETYWVKIFMSGPYEVAEQVCREFCLSGLCVTIDRTKYIYTGGEEDGFVIGLINYPRFPSTPDQLNTEAEELANKLLEACYQQSWCIMNPNCTTWHTLRNV